MQIPDSPPKDLDHADPKHPKLKDLDHAGPIDRGSACPK